jgi:hypothetical protein
LISRLDAAMAFYWAENEGKTLLDNAPTTNRRVVASVSTARVTTILLLPVITICWILLVDPRLFGH